MPGIVRNKNSDQLIKYNLSDGNRGIVYLFFIYFILFFFCFLKPFYSLCFYCLLY